MFKQLMIITFFLNTLPVVGMFNRVGNRVVKKYVSKKMDVSEKVPGAKKFSNDMQKKNDDIGLKVLIAGIVGGMAVVCWSEWTEYARERDASHAENREKESKTDDVSTVMHK